MCVCVCVCVCRERSLAQAFPEHVAADRQRLIYRAQAAHVTSPLESKRELCEDDVPLWFGCLSLESLSVGDFA